MLQHIPNVLTCARIVLAAIFPFCDESVHLAIILVALATEFFDGFIARLFGWQSYLGQLLDPIADKLFVLSVSLTWVYLGKLSLSQWLMLSVRDIGVALMLLYVVAIGQMLQFRAIEARLPSKITTVLQYLLFFVILFGVSQILEPLVLATAISGSIAVIHYLWLLRGRM